MYLNLMHQKFRLVYFKIEKSLESKIAEEGNLLLSSYFLKLISSFFLQFTYIIDYKINAHRHCSRQGTKGELAIIIRCGMCICTVGRYYIVSIIFSV